MKQTQYAELKALNRSNASERYKAAAIVARECGDNELAEVLDQMSKQVDFDNNINAAGPLDRTRAKLDDLVAARSHRGAMVYQSRLLDDEILEVSGGEVTDAGYSRIDSSYRKNGLFDPDIFGGSGKPLIVDNPDEYNSERFDFLGLGFGHIQLPSHVVLDSDYLPIGMLLHIPEDDVKAIVTCEKYVVINPGKCSLVKGQVVTESEYKNAVASNGDLDISCRILTGGDAIYALLEGLGCSDQPERLAFTVIPVLPPKYRPMAYVDSYGGIAADPVNELYYTVIRRAERLRKLMTLGAPEVILRIEQKLINQYVDDIFNYFDGILRRGKYSRDYMKNLLFATRKRVFDFEVPEGIKTSDIESLNIYPEKIKVVDDKGKIKEARLADIIKVNQDAQYDRESELSSKITQGDITEDEQAEADELLHKMDDLTESIWSGAEWVADFTVRFDKDLGIYVPVDKQPDN